MIKPFVLPAFGLGIVCAALSAWGADLFLFPVLEGQAGYEKNPTRQPGGGSGSAYWAGSSGIGFSRLAENTETTLTLQYGRKTYAEDDFDWKEDVLLNAHFRLLLGSHQVGSGFSAGVHRDKALPEDDAAYQQVEPYWIRPLATIPAEWMLKGVIQRTDFEHYANAPGIDRMDTRFALRTGWRLFLNRQTSLWAEIEAERNFSEADAEEYTGYGGMTGIQVQPVPRLTLEGGLSWSNRRFDEGPAEDLYREKPLSLNGRATCRIRPWLELFVLGNWDSVDSSVNEEDYTRWQVGTGLQFLFEYALPASRP